MFEILDCDYKTRSTKSACDKPVSQKLSSCNTLTNKLVVFNKLFSSLCKFPFPVMSPRKKNIRLEYFRISYVILKFHVHKLLNELLKIPYEISARE